MKLALGCDHGGFAYKTKLIEKLKKDGYAVEDFGCFSEDSCDYPDYALPVAEAVKDGKADFGILICSTGIGVSIAANKVKGIRCAHVHDVESARLTRNHNDANVLAFGAKIISEQLMYDITDAFLNSSFDGGRHLRRVDKITAIENKYFK
ncbi:MAG: ribose 5-phosphate isomerase B [Clostridia bacterium]|nr:ribose 5-phosphate isomerase B [Clostridia bacterium]